MPPSRAYWLLHADWELEGAQSVQSSLTSVNGGRARAVARAVRAPSPSPAGHAEERESGAAKARAAPRDFAPVSATIVPVFALAFSRLSASPRPPPTSAVRRGGVESIDVTPATLQSPARRFVRR